MIKNGVSALLWATILGHDRIVNLLLAQGADPTKVSAYHVLGTEVTLTLEG
jgi:ankyrin repeat protein